MATEAMNFRIAPPRRASEHAAMDEHSVQFYDADDFLLEGVTRFVAAGIADGDCAIVIATQAHREDLEVRLANRGLDLNAARRRGSYLALDAAETLAKFMVGDRPDAGVASSSWGSQFRGRARSQRAVDFVGTVTDL